MEEVWHGGFDLGMWVSFGLCFFFKGELNKILCGCLIGIIMATICWCQSWFAAEVVVVVSKILGAGGFGFVGSFQIYVRCGCCCRT
jgi:hypothetical protein